MNILAIETSCDETAFAIITVDESSNTPLFTEKASSLHSQAELHAEFGGVFPNLAKREHAKNFLPLLTQVLHNESVEIISFSEEMRAHARQILEKYPEHTDALIEYAQNHKPSNIDYIAVTQGPGLTPALWVGITYARALSYLWNIRMVGVNHMEGHIVSVLAQHTEARLPALALLISGGHTQLIDVKEWGQYSLLGETQDDALGEAYDKVARMMQIPYPGGPEISRRARLLREQGIASQFEFPRPMINTKDHAFSFSGLKTSVLYKIQSLEKEAIEHTGSPSLSEEIKNHIALAFEDAITDVLIKKLSFALEKTHARSLIVGGGVIANQHLRTILTEFAHNHSLALYIPTHEHATDNAVMIGIAGYFTLKREEAHIAPDIQARGTMSLSTL